MITPGNTFRQDINALRALSVIAVVGFHLKVPGFAGGFAGVDIFLVITGYLMTRKILLDLSQNRFSFSQFWMARMRRIYPALAATVVFAVLTGWFFTMPDQYLKHLLQALSALAFVSNFAFRDANGYFALAAQTKPLLHTWSLSIEWQFYLLMPVVVAFLWKRDRVLLVRWAFIAVGAASLAWCLWQSHIDNTASSFFSLAARAWEPLAGGLIAIAEISHKLPNRSSLTRVVAVAGWLILIACIASPIPENRWPSLLTLLPVLGAVLVVTARYGAAGSRLIGAYPVQRIGDWSYSIYLWHWPIWVFAIGWLSLHGYTVGIEHKAALIVVSVILGAASYYLIEQPIRLQRDIWTPAILLKGSVTLFASCLVLAGMAFMNDGFPSRLPDYLRPAELARRMNTPRDECFRNSHSVKSALGAYCSFGRVTTNPTMILWGDSFANQYLEPLSAAAFAQGIHGLIATQSGCRAFVDDPKTNAADLSACRSFNRETFDFVTGPDGPSIIVLASNWSAAGEIASLTDRLLADDKTVILIMPLLNVGFDVPQRWIENQVRSGAAVRDWVVETTPALTLQELRQSIDREVLQKHRANPRLVIADPQAVICDNGYCSLVKDGQANFRDTAHISNVTAMQYRDMFDAALKSASSNVVVSTD